MPIKKQEIDLTVSKESKKVKFHKDYTFSSNKLLHKTLMVRIFIFIESIKCSNHGSLFMHLISGSQSLVQIREHHSFRNHDEYQYSIITQEVGFGHR